VPIKSTQPGATKAPPAPHLGLLVKDATWVAIKPGNWMMYSNGMEHGDTTPPTPMLLVSVEPSNYGLKVEFACCDNPKCTRRLKFESKWNGRHFERAAEEQVDGK
jgi:hypothetical protein